MLPVGPAISSAISLAHHIVGMCQLKFFRTNHSLVFTVDELLLLEET
jgi:hypothetical protein